MSAIKKFVGYDLDREMTPGPDNDPRLLGRTRIGKGALLFKDKPGARGCKSALTAD